MKPDICSQKVKDLNATLEALGAEKRELEARRERLELPAIDREMLSRLVDKFEEVLAEGTNPQKKAPSAPDLPLLNKPKLYRTRHPERSPFYAVLNQFFDRFSREYELRFEWSYGPLRSIVPTVERFLCLSNRYRVHGAGRTQRA